MAQEAQHTPGPWALKMDGTLTGVWAEVFQECVDPASGEEWDRELFRSDTAYVRIDDAYSGSLKDFNEGPEQYRLTEDGAEHLANARLIAAAPDMLAALRDIALLKGRHTWMGTSEAYIEALAAVAMDAIAKATQPSA